MLVQPPRVRKTQALKSFGASARPSTMDGSLRMTNPSVTPSSEQDGRREELTARWLLPLDCGGHASAVASFEDNWPWPRRRPFQAGLAATAGFKIRRCRANPEGEW
jgi:hypothetical protein